MITLKQQETLFTEISRKLKKRIVTYAVGGNAMIYWGHKDVTVDIDMVFTDAYEMRDFEEALKSSGYTRIDSSNVYGLKDNRPVLLKRTEQERFDLFLNKVIRFDFSDAMKKRAEKTFEYGKNLVIKVADYHDVFLMKCVTDRVRDKADIKMILENEDIDWNIIISEARNQVRLGNGGSIFDVLGECQKIKEEMGLKIPDRFFHEVWNMFSDKNMTGKPEKEEDGRGPEDAHREAEEGINLAEYSSRKKASLEKDKHW
jgi:hypothetical protein